MRRQDDDTWAAVGWPKETKYPMQEGGKDLQKRDQRVAGGKGIKLRLSRGAASGT